MFDSAMPEALPITAERIIVRGLVQGVGFRPTVWRLAAERGIRGTVLNNGSGVEIEAAGTSAALDDFVAAIRNESPRLARIDAIERERMDAAVFAADFRIIESEATAVRTGVVPDANVCGECVAETFDPHSRRYRYPFTNCTHCGPRLSIVEDIPYDRQNTTMLSFEMCADCRVEYEDPADRRFHAQPIACPACGPKVWLTNADGSVYSGGDVDPINAVADLIKDGKIVAIKGIGGFQFACDATNEEAVKRLRERKHRERKPFALMVRDLDVLRTLCEVTDSEAELMQSAAAPIVILQTRVEKPVAPSVAPGIRTLGVMLPNTPLHHLIMQKMERPIVLTSGNLTDEPQSTDNESAIGKLGPIAEYFLMNDRPVAQRVDDSVVKVMAGEPRMFRRARGYAPSPFVMPAGFEDAPSLLAFGGELKNTFCLLKDGQAIVSQHIGDLENAEAQADYRHNLGLYERLYEHTPEALVCDLHPEYLSSKLARKRSVDSGLPLIETQHHHAHIAACLAENGVPLDSGRVLGIALDGLGFGDDGSFWGGEFLLADYASYTRLGTFKPVAMPGGEQAIREPWRNTYAHLMAEMGWDRLAADFGKLDIVAFLDAKPRTTLDAMIERKINSPLASSAGRLFDAAAAAVGICRERAAYEGQGAIEFEAIVDEDVLNYEDEQSAYRFEISTAGEGGIPFIDPLPMWHALLGDLLRETPAPVIAARFHKGVAIAIVRMITTLTGRNMPMTIALSGGVWQNKILFEQVTARLESANFRVLTHRQFPANDGCLSLGQAAIAAARLLLS